MDPDATSDSGSHVAAAGMAAWRLTLSTPECPSGRPLLLVSNDVTVSSGSFSPQEDLLFRHSADVAASEGVPLLYMAANSGARIGVASEVWRSLHVAWEQDGIPDSGVKYLYLAPQDYQRLKSQVTADHVTGPRGELRWRLTAVVGAEDGIGVECLSGSAAIASSFSKAYAEGAFTLTYVTGRTVGIGAYLARLGIRCIQRQDSPIILTGYSALNKLLGRNVYTSHLQVLSPCAQCHSPQNHKQVLSLCGHWEFPQNHSSKFHSVSSAPSSFNRKLLGRNVFNPHLDIMSHCVHCEYCHL